VHRYLVLLLVTCAALLAIQMHAQLRHGLSPRLHAVQVIAVAAYILLTYLAEHTRLQVKGEIWQNLSTTAHIGSLLLFPPPLPMLITFGAALASVTRRRGVTPAKRVFNITHPTLSVGLTGLLCSLVVQPTEILHGDFIRALPCLVLLLALYYLFDVGTMVGLVALLNSDSPWRVWWHTCRHTLLPELGAGSIGILVAIVWRYNPVAVTLLVLPAVALRAAFRANARAEERARALRQRGSQLETVLAVGQHLSLQQSDADLLQAVVDAARAVLGAQTVTGYVRDDDDHDMLRRIALTPAAARAPGPACLPIATCAAPSGEGEVRVPIEHAGQGIIGLLLATGVSGETGSGDRDVLGILAAQTAIALQNAQLHERALALAAHDSLTGLLNRRALQTRLDEEIARAVRGGHALCLLMVDLDDFGAINNTYGHFAGDLTLRAAAQAMAHAVRAMDVVARYGGDELVVLLPETPLEQGLEAAERVRAAIAALRVIEGSTQITLTASIGAAALPEHGISAEELLRAADQAAYAAKHCGKGRVARPEDAALSLDQDPVALAAQLAHANMATVAALAAAVDAKDAYTQGHSQRVSAYAAALAETLALSAAEVARITLTGQLHDVGKIGVPDSILSKPGRLTADEYQIIQQHTVIGERMLAGVPFLREILPAVRHHHERWDGQGYPDGLRGEQIPRDALILAVADAFDAMTSSRTYRSALPLAEACRRIAEGSGSQFDPRVVQAFEQAVAGGSIVSSASLWPVSLHDVIDRAS
jgi:diguanylate cyclase (GGDEF)-like protein